ncbi:hypothetical protein BC936DRAFT_147100 [Jimgerdemannia flammicorona]|uniref:Uncharacterized protein n=1 Tax=Jimgerdemannia flammicorona TaxID=994334 RepID=A0A433D631_9FUNG|nr:hypothetical protein BC936DRAFT_147100 [Jimgerdemannia flammicorona]
MLSLSDVLSLKLLGKENRARGIAGVASLLCEREENVYKQIELRRLFEKFNADDEDTQYIGECISAA